MYSQGLRYSQLLQSGRYAGQAALGSALGVEQALISKAVRLLDAPEGMWAKVVDPSTITWREAEVLIAAYKSQEFVGAISKRDGLSAKQLYAIARQAIRKAPDAKRSFGLVKGARGYVVKHPAIKDKGVAEKVLSAVKEVLAENDAT